MFPNELFPDDLPPEDQPQPGRGPTRAALLSVWELTEQVKDLLETTFPVVSS